MLLERKKSWQDFDFISSHDEPFFRQMTSSHDEQANKKESKVPLAISFSAIRSKSTSKPF